MELLDSYIKSIKSYLPKNQRDDIVKELYENLFSRFKEKEEELNRPLTETEQLDMLKQFGEPMTVAKSYNPDLHGLSFGRQLIGPDLFPGYIKLLLLNLLITLTIFSLVIIAGLPLNIPMIFLSLLIQFSCITLLFIILEFVKRKTHKAWMFPPAAMSIMFPVPRWQVISGLIIWSVFTLWWIALHDFTFLLFGNAAGYLKFTSSWYQFYIPVLLLMLAGIVQRSINFVRPDLSWVLPVMRFVINGFGMVLQFYMIKDYPFVIVSGAAKGSQHYKELAQVFNHIMFGAAFSWLWVFMLVNFIIYGWIIVRNIIRLHKLKHEKGVPA